jgi:hypothetical protein
MSARTGVFTKYVVEFAAANLTFSNDPSVGDVVVDADVTVTMSRWTDGTTFKITLYDLPQQKVEALKATLQPKTYPSLNIKLGYFETKVQPVVAGGIYDKIDSKAAADASTGQNRQVTSISGFDAAVVACRDTPYTANLSDDQTGKYEDAAKGVLSAVFTDKNKAAHPGIDSLVDNNIHSNAPLPKGPSPSKFHNNTVLTALDELAGKAKAEFLVSDKQVFLSPSIERTDVAAAVLDPSTNLAKFDPSQKKLPSTSDGAKNGQPQSSEDAGPPVRLFNFTSLGDPTMRPGQTITVNGVDKFPNSLKCRIRNVEHQFSASTGYVCAGAAAEPLSDGAKARDFDNQIKQDAAAAAQAIAGKIQSAAVKNANLEVTSVKGAADTTKYPYQADLFYGQPQGAEKQPSVEVAIDAQNDHLYQHKPIASPFAWRKCGLTTPVYPTMKALVAHNLGSADDGIVTGYLWSTQPAFPPPPNHAGDWWLSLPIDLDPTSLPSDQTQFTRIDDWEKFDWTKFDQTKAVNDLTASNGHRVIEIKGLKISVGAGKLAAVGTRPGDGPDDDFLIEHASGTSVHIDSNGALTITASGTSVQIDSHGALTIDASNASLTIKGTVVIEGSLEIK